MAEVEANGLTFHVQRIGAGESTVVFLHGLVMDNLSSWYFTIANPVAQFADVITYDLRGHGKSDRPPTGYTIDDMVDDLIGILDALGVEHPVYLVGNSLGGLIALATAIREPGRVAGLVLVDAHSGAAGWGTEMAATLGLQGDERDAMIAESFKSWLGRHSERKSTRLAKSAEALVVGTSLIDDLRTAPALDSGAIAALNIPVLAIYGEHSDIRIAGEELARNLANSEIRIFPEATHSVLWESTSQLRTQIVDWLATHTNAR